MVGSVHISTTPPPIPGGADFAIYIDFKKGEGNPARVFQAADTMIQALQRLDHALCNSIDSHIEPILVLEEIESGSLKIWLKDVLSASDDEALKTLDWKPAVGNYLVRAKYVYIEWANKTGTSGSLLELARELKNIAAATNVKHLPDYAPPSITDLSEVTKEMDKAKGFLIAGDRMSYLPAPSVGTALVPAVDFDLSVRWAPEDLLALSTRETTRYEKMPMNLIVKRPDYLGTSKWDFRHGKTPLSAKVADDEWLGQFQTRKIDVRPGDALKCLVTLERSYGFDNELIEETYTVTKVLDVLQNQFRQTSFFDEGTT